jgi:hypothetical protein
MNYVHKVERPNGSATKVTANANGIYLTFIKGKDGRPLEVSRYTNAMVYMPGDLYVRKDAYAGVIRQVAAVLNEKPRQVGFQFEETKEMRGDACITLDIRGLTEKLIGAEPDNGRCPGCTKSSDDQSSCFDSCPLFPKED